jgi:hypothetical protein
MVKITIFFCGIFCYFTSGISGQILKHKSKYFFVDKVIDNRNQKTESIGNIFLENSSIPKVYYLPIDFENWIKQNIETIVAENKKVNPYFVNLSVDKLFFSENLIDKGSVTGNFRFDGSFYLINSSDSISLFPFKYSVKYRRPIADDTDLIKHLSNKLTDVTNRLEAWFAINYGINQKLARHVTVKTGNFNTLAIDPDTLYYFQRKLNINDFVLRKSNSKRFAAAVFTNLAYQSDVKMKNDTIFLDFKTKVYKVKGMSWYIENELNQYALAHEQLHFDITHLVAEKFKERLRDEALPAQDFGSRIQYLFIEYYRLMNTMQNKYDNETNHGLNKTEQAIWGNNVASELNKFASINK